MIEEQHYKREENIKGRANSSLSECATRVTESVEYILHTCFIVETGFESDIITVLAIINQVTPGFLSFGSMP